jgi:hypothetical protein
MIPDLKWENMKVVNYDFVCILFPSTVPVLKYYFCSIDEPYER